MGKTAVSFHKMTDKAAIYYQRSKSVQEEFKLIELVTERELVVEQLEAIIKEVKEQRRELEDDTILETFQIMNHLRDVSMSLLKAIGAWQVSFTKAVRPTLLQCDYMVEKMVKHMDFINSSKIRKIFNFQFFRGNALLLPYPNLKAETPIKVGLELGKEIKKFSSPPEADVIACYQVLINSLPDDIYDDRLVALDKWLVSPWVPRIWISSSNKKFFTSAAPLKPDETNTNANTNSKKDKGATAAAKQAEELKPLPAIKRRNQMLVKQAEGLLVLTGTAEGIGSGNVDAPLSLEEQEEIEQLDFHYKELESMFLPKLGRRSVKTMVVGGSRLQPMQRSTMRTGAMFFSHTTKADDKAMQNALSGLNTNAFMRTEANLVTKRDRILADRKPGEVQYQKHLAGSKSLRKDEESVGEATASIDDDLPPAAGVRRASDATWDTTAGNDNTARPSTSGSTSTREGSRGGRRMKPSLTMSTAALRDWYASHQQQVS